MILIGYVLGIFGMGLLWHYGWQLPIGLALVMMGRVIAFESKEGR